MRSCSSPRGCGEWGPRTPVESYFMLPDSHQAPGTEENTHPDAELLPFSLTSECQSLNLKIGIILYEIICLAHRKCPRIGMLALLTSLLKPAWAALSRVIFPGSPGGGSREPCAGQESCLELQLVRQPGSSPCRSRVQLATQWAPNPQPVSFEDSSPLVTLGEPFRALSWVAPPGGESQADGLWGESFWSISGGMGGAWCFCGLPKRLIPYPVHTTPHIGSCLLSSPIRCELCEGRVCVSPSSVSPWSTVPGTSLVLEKRSVQ